MRASEVSSATWRKSTRSSGGSEQTNCVEVAELCDQVAMRDSKDPAGPVLAFTRTQWHALISSIQTSDFD